MDCGIRPEYHSDDDKILERMKIYLDIRLEKFSFLFVKEFSLSLSKTN